MLLANGAIGGYQRANRRGNGGDLYMGADKPFARCDPCDSRRSKRKGN